MYLDSCRSQAADEGDAIEAHSPEEGRAGGLHHKVLQENPQLCEQGPTVRVSSGGVTQSQKAVINEGLQQAALSAEEHEDSSWHQEDLIAGDELENVLLIGRELVQEVPNEQQTVRPHRVKNLLSVRGGMKQ